MKLENQVCTLEQAKKLKELGVVGETEYYFRGDKIWHFNEVTDWTNQEQLYELIESGDEADNIVPVFTVAELGVMLPRETYTFLPRNDINWECLNNDYGLTIRTYETEAEARAEMLIYLLESGLTTAKEVNQRLTQNQ